MTPTEPPPFAKALGRVPSGLFVATTLHEGRPLGFVASFVQQLGFEPPTVGLAVGRDRAFLGAVRASGAFGLSVLDKQSEKLMGRFFKKPAPGESPFDGLELATGAAGSPVLAEALAWLDCRVRGEHDLGDHVVVFGEVVDGLQAREGEPSIHLRKSGLGY